MGLNPLNRWLKQLSAISELMTWHLSADWSAMISLSWLYDRQSSRLETWAAIHSSIVTREITASKRISDGSLRSRLSL